MVCDIDEEILKKYVGIGNYTNYRIEYRLPRDFITLDNLKDFLDFEPYSEFQIEEFRKKYKYHYEIPVDEDDAAKKLMLKKSLQFNGQRNWE